MAILHRFYCIHNFTPISYILFIWTCVIRLQKQKILNTKLPEDILETLDSKIKTVKKDKPVNKWKKKAMKKAIKMQEKGLYTGDFLPISRGRI